MIIWYWFEFFTSHTSYKDPRKHMSRSIIPFHVLDLSGLYTMLSYASEPKRGISMGTSCGKPVSPPFSKPKKAMEYHSVVVGLVKEGFIIRNDMQIQGPRNGSYIWIYLQWSRCYPLLNGVRSICKWILNIKGVLVEGCWFLNSWSGGGSTKWQRHFQHSSDDN